MALSEESTLARRCVLIRAKMSPRVKTFLGMSLRNGSFFICYLYFLFAIFLLAKCMYKAGQYMEPYPQTLGMIYLGLAVKQLITIILSLLLQIGIFTNKKGLFLPWLIMNTIYILAAFVSAIVMLVLAINMEIYTLLFVTLVNVLTAIIIMYFHSVILSYRAAVFTNNPDNLINQASCIETPTIVINNAYIIAKK